MVRISDPVLGARSLRLWVQAAEAWERSHPPAPEKCRGRLEKGPVPGARRDCRGEWGSLRVPARVAPWGCVGPGPRSKCLKDRFPLAPMEAPPPGAPGEGFAQLHGNGGSLEPGGAASQAVWVGPLLPRLGSAWALALGEVSVLWGQGGEAAF